MMKDFDLDNLERKNIFKVSDDMFNHIQAKVLESNASNIDIDTLERKNLYTTPDHLFDTIQNNVLSEIKVEKKAPIFNLKWAYAAAASLAIIFGSTFLYNSSSNSEAANTKAYAVNAADKTESEIAYETLKNDLTSVEIDNPKEVNSINTIASLPQEKEVKKEALKPVLKQTEAQMVEYLDSFTSSEIEDLANNSNQDVYLDLYN